MNWSFIFRKKALVTLHLQNYTSIFVSQILGGVTKTIKKRGFEHIKL